MNDTSPPTEDDPSGGTPPGEDRGATATDDSTTSRMRSVTEARRSTNDRLVGGVCTGLARHLDVDPVIVRIAFAVLTFVGGAGIIMYVAAWFLLPSDSGPSVATDWFRLDENEEKVRVGGLVLAGVVSVLAIVGDSGWGPGLGGGWLLIPAALLVWLCVIRPRQRAMTKPERREWADDVAQEARTAGREAGDRAGASATAVADEWNQRRRERHAPRSRALTGLTVSIVAIAMAVTRLVADSNGGTSWTTYVLVALAVIGAALLLSSFVGEGGPLIWIGLALVVALGVGSTVPNPRIGQLDVAPRTAAEVQTRYTHGIGDVRIDLSEVDDPQGLLGRSVSVDTGIGQTTVIVPNGLNVDVEADLQAGEVTVLGRTASGNDTALTSPAGPGRALNLTIDHTIGDIEVIRQ
ncbi:PspC domain-containing protein [Aeromicrobium sp. CF3.5]|uniref:PspC domain-containing protein n=1 Tax=Aeromicrobium sp. CF3.5 TaxID=3373078 RepID=UPI003EE455A8